MLSAKRPLKIACGALLFAFGLSLIVCISDPRAVREATLARNEPQRPFSGDEPALVARQKEPTESTEAIVIAPAPESEPTLAALLREQQDGTQNEPPGHSHGTSLIPSPLDATLVSQSPGIAGHPIWNETETTEPMSIRRRQPRTIPVVSPDQLHRAQRLKEVELLPPPPDYVDLAEQQPDQASRRLLTSIPRLPSTPYRQQDAAGTASRRIETEMQSIQLRLDRLMQAMELDGRLDHAEQSLTDHQHLVIEQLTEAITALQQQLHRDNAWASSPEDAFPGIPGAVVATTDDKLDEILHLLRRMTPSTNDTLSSTTIAQDPDLPVIRPR